MKKQVLMNEIEKHQARVGNKPEARLQWAIDFAVKDLGHLTIGDRENLRGELAAFCGTPQAQDVYAYKRSHFVRLAIAQLGQHDWQGAIGVLPRWEQVQEAQGEFRRILRVFLATGHFTLGPFAITYDVYRQAFRINTKPRQCFFSERVQKEKAPWGVLTFARLLGAFGANVETCPEPTCGKIFVAKRLNQNFCSKQCQSRTTTRTYRDRLRTKQLEAGIVPRKRGRPRKEAAVASQRKRAGQKRTKEG